MAQEIERLSIGKGQSSSLSGHSQHQVNLAFSPGGGGAGELRQKYDILEGIHVKLKREYDGLREKLAEYEFK